MLFAMTFKMILKYWLEIYDWLWYTLVTNLSAIRRGDKMSDKLKRQAIADGVYFSWVKDAKFKLNRLTVNFIMPLSAQTASNNAVVPYILRMGCKKWPDFTSLNSRLCDLYGASLRGEVSKNGGWQILELSIKMMDNRFALEGEDLTALCAELLADIALDPKLDKSGDFHEKDTALERQFLMDSIEAEINEKRSYAISKCVQVMCQDEPVAIHRLGEFADAERITPKSAADAYRNIIKTAQVEIQFTGSGDPSVCLDIFSRRFADVKREPITHSRTKLRGVADLVREKVESMEVSQSKLVMGLRTGEGSSMEHANARRVFAALFGGTPFSKLFMNVREKLSLCYYCAARYDNATGILMVDSGVEAANKQKALEEIMI